MPRLSRPLKATLGIAIIIIAAIGLWWYYPLLLPAGEVDPGDEVTVLLSGELQDVDAGHGGSGLVQLVESTTGEQSIQFIDVEITTGPDLYVYLSKQSSFSGIYDGPGEYIDLGRTRRFSGNFTVSIPDDIDGQEYASVIIWCKTFAVLFTYAVLE